LEITNNKFLRRVTLVTSNLFSAGVEIRIRARLPGTPKSARERARLQPLLMAIPIRHSDPTHVTAGARTFFVTSSILGKRSLLQSHRSAGLFVSVLYDYRAQRKFRLHEFVVMPDHFHVLLSVESNLTIERAVQFIKGGFAFRAGRELGFSAPVWQKGFSEVRILDAEAFERVSEYIRGNPVARHLVADAADYPYSSAQEGFQLDPAPQGLKPISRGALGGMAKAMP
jgi:putative transposase